MLSQSIKTIDNSWDQFTDQKINRQMSEEFLWNDKRGHLIQINFSLWVQKFFPRRDSNHWPPNPHPHANPQPLR